MYVYAGGPAIEHAKLSREPGGVSDNTVRINSMRKWEGHLLSTQNFTHAFRGDSTGQVSRNGVGMGW